MINGDAMSEHEKMYLITYWSPWGMGSDTEVGLITGSNLHDLIVMETDKYMKSPNRADSRFSGTCEGEKFCDSDDPEERVNDVIQKRLNTCTTYAGKNDLIELPDSVSITTSKLKLDNTIVRMFNQFGYGRDIIFGEGEFTMYSLDQEQDFFREKNVLSSSYEDGWLRFVEYSLKNVSENHMSGFGDPDWIVATARDKINRMSAEQKGVKVKHKGAYISDLIPEILTDDYVARQIEEAQCTLKKFSNLPSLKDEYYSHIYDIRNCRSDYCRKMLKDISKNDRSIDHTKIAYDYPIAPDQFGVRYIEKRKDASHHLTYSELFKNGYDMRYLIADRSNWAPTEDGLGDPDLFAVFLSVFAYD